MAHSIPEIIKLNHKFNKAVKVGRSKPTADGRDKTAWRVSGTSEILDKPIQIYRQWYRFLQLAIELEEQKVKIIVEEKRVKLPKPKKDAYGHMRSSYLKPTIRPIKINWKKLFFCISYNGSSNNSLFTFVCPLYPCCFSICSIFKIIFYMASFVFVR